MKTIQKLIILMLFISSYALSVTLNSTGIYAPNKNITVQISNQAADKKNWIGIYPRGSSNAWGNVITWEWTNGKNSVDMGGLANGSYEARLFYNNSFNLEATTPIVVDANAARVKTTKAVYGVNENIEVDTRKFPNELEVWVGIYPVGSSNDWGNVLDWSWAQDEKIIMDALPKGNYEVRLFFHNSFKLEASYPFAVGDNTPQIHTTSAQYAVGEKISVVVNGARAGQKDWVGIFSKNDNNSWTNVYAWSFVENGTTVLSESRKNMPAGDYEIRLFFNNEYGVDAEVRASYGFKITGDANNDKVYPPETTLTPRATDKNIPEPTLNNPSIDNVFDTKISKVGTPNTTRAPYPKTQAWNKDMSLIYIYFRLYDANTLKKLDFTKGGNLCSPSLGFRWSNVEADTFYALQTTGKFMKGHLNNDNTITCTVIEDFFDQNKIPKLNLEMLQIGQGEGNIDYNDKYVIFTVKKKNDESMYILLYNIQTQTRVWIKKIIGAKWLKDDGKYTGHAAYDNGALYDWATVSPSGKYIVENRHKNGMFRYDINFQDKRRLEYIDDNGHIASQGGHGDIGFDTDGNEVFVQFIPGGVRSTKINNPDEKGKKILKSPYGGGHVSCRNTQRRGWCYFSTSQEGYNEIFALKLDGSDNPTVQRFTQSYNPIMWWWDKDDNKYKSALYDATEGIPSPDGTKVLFNSRWNKVHEKKKKFVYETNVFIAESIDNP